MGKVELQTSRAKRIAALEVAITMKHREEIQADLGKINARLKQINIEEATQAKATADQRQAAGHAEQQDNLRRASAKLPASPSTRPPTQRAVTAPPRPLTRGQFLLKHAKQMRKAIDTIKPDRRLPHTIEFHAQLDAFIRQQTRHLDEPSLPVLGTTETSAATESDWKTTWTAEADQETAE